MAARVAVELAALQRRLAEEEVGVARELRELVRRRRVAGVRERRAGVRDAEAVRLDGVVRNAQRGHVESGGAEGRATGVLVQAKRLLEHLRDPEAVGELVHERDPAGRQPQLRRRHEVAEAIDRAPDPRDDVTPVVEVEVRDRDRVEPRPSFPGPQLREDAGTAVEEKPSRSLDEVAGLLSARVRPRRRAPDDGQLHPHIFSHFTSGSSTS